MIHKANFVVHITPKFFFAPFEILLYENVLHMKSFLTQKMLQYVLQERNGAMF